MMDPRFAVVSVRRIEDMENVAESLGIRSVMKFYPLTDEDTGLELCGVSWQEPGTGSLLLSVAVLCGCGVGNQGGAAGTMTNNSGCLIHTT
jgi:hypothetical protein